MSGSSANRTAPRDWASPSPFYQEAIAGDARPAHPDFTEWTDPDIPIASVPRARYTSAAFAALEMERMWPRVWQFACREEQIPEVGDVHVYDGPGASLLIVRAGPDDIRAFYNSCRHRGMRLCKGDASVSRIVCPFHSFAWKLDGSLDHVPSRWDFPDIDFADFGLSAVKTGRWKGFVFVNRDPACAPLEDYLGHMVPLFRDWPLENLRLATLVRKTIKANWKLCMEGFIEAFHLVGLHPHALQFGGDSSTQYDVWEGDPNATRFLAPTGFQSDHYPRQLNQQEILDASLRTVLGEAEFPQLPEGVSARQFSADAMRAQFGAPDALSDAEVGDAAQYSLFPNFITFRSLGYPYAYRFTPVRGNPEESVFDFFIFAPAPADSSELEVRRIDLGPDDRYSDSGAFPPWLGLIYDQDAEGLADGQEGLRSGGDADIHFSRYQEVRLRHLHQTLMSYLDGDQQ